MVEIARGMRAIDRARARANELVGAGDLLRARRELVAVLSKPMLDEDGAAAVRERLASVQAELLPGACEW